jgi:MFS family permease
MVADAAPERLRGTAFGLFHLVSGVALFAASLLAGVLWQGLGSAATFQGGALLSSLALVGLLWVIRRDPSAERDPSA